VSPRAAVGVATALLVLVVLAACEREERRFRELPPGAAAEGLVTQQDQLQPGPMLRDPEARHPYERNAWAIAEGKTLYNHMNCAGCHSPRGGGNIGPSLIDSLWIYGVEPENLFQTIEQGRPRGMPAFRGRLGNTEIWKIVAYVRALNGLTRQDTRSGRGDEMHEVSADVQTEPMIPEAQRVPAEEPDPYAKDKGTPVPTKRPPTGSLDTTRRPARATARPARPDSVRTP
jgi:cytochrome c oxidase cbb3-type subunit 3